ncbi:hypothetical protein GOODEAATRI_030481 [Goodea atripinnis]|uniref:Uncharacterized protein n=1 Tax=Goodea atripinnis TaxID=208336 RepID=A0ABV0N7S6_9TELE
MLWRWKCKRLELNFVQAFYFLDLDCPPLLNLKHALLPFNSGDPEAFKTAKYNLRKTVKTLQREYRKVLRLHKRATTRGTCGMHCTAPQTTVGETGLWSYPVHLFQ